MGEKRMLAWWRDIAPLEPEPIYDAFATVLLDMPLRQEELALRIDTDQSTISRWSSSASSPRRLQPKPEEMTRSLAAIRARLDELDKTVGRAERIVDAVQECRVATTEYRRTRDTSDRKKQERARKRLEKALQS